VPALIGVIVLLTVLTSLRFYTIEQYEVFGEVALRLRPVGRLAFILFSEIAITGFAILLRLAVNHEENKGKMAEMERMQLETELRFLKAQMSPHFLFNTINNIYSLTLIKSDKAPDALMKLSDLLRYLLYESQRKVPLQKEVEALHTYAELFQLRHEEPLNLKISNETDAKDIFIEPLLLIPLLENAVKHSGLGISSQAYGIMEILLEKNTLVIRTDNSKIHPPLTSEASGIGLINIKKRLQMLYPDQHTLDIIEDNHRFTVTLKISKA
jgi:LytS/YehU family sensor histidine kinase